LAEKLGDTREEISAISQQRPAAAALRMGAGGVATAMPPCADRSAARAVTVQLASMRMMTARSGSMAVVSVPISFMRDFLSSDDGRADVPQIAADPLGGSQRL
jgi:hypothetical protein